ncbi:MAG: M23 family metallopeptidase [Candidatus Cloacimonetes bacterium]|nr:M23 family metallopeptidase [Candidatus Cloacimonadota bacterium]
MKRFLGLSLIIMLIVLSSCTRRKTVDEAPQANVEEFTIPAGTNIYKAIEERNYDTDFIREIIGRRLAEKAEEAETFVKITTCGDSLVIDQVRITSCNVDFDINKTVNDSSEYIVNVEKPILKGGSIFQVLTDLGMKESDVGYYAWMMGEYIDATSIDIGDLISVTYFTDSLKVKHFEKFTYKPDKTSIHEFYILGERELRYNLVELPYELKRKFITGEISEEFNTWDAAMNELHIIPYIRQQANNAMDSQIAFATDARIGDKFEVYIEEKYVNGERQPRGKLLYAEYSGKYTGTRTAYRFSDDDPASAYTGMYTTSAKRLVTDAVRTPLDRMHVTSPFGYRIHPVYGNRRLHKGMDLRGKTGTSVYAVSSGSVIKAANNGNGYGKEVQIKHDNGMVTQYAHLSKISTRKGSKVKKGQVIGAVGSTGVSTGPHLHFGVMIKNKWVNPQTNLKMVGANELKDERRKVFQQQIKDMDAEMAILRVN